MKKNIIKFCYIYIIYLVPYMNMIREMFPNAEIIIDRFHMVQNIGSLSNSGHGEK